MPDLKPIVIALSERDAAKACGCCAKTLYWARKRGELRGCMIGRHVVYLPEDLREWLLKKRDAGNEKPAA